MKLFMIIYYFGKIGGTIGPLPYDMDECLLRAAEMNTKIATEYERRKEDPEFVAALKGVTPGTMIFRCETWAARPANTWVAP